MFFNREMEVKKSVEDFAIFFKTGDIDWSLYVFIAFELFHIELDGKIVNFRLWDPSGVALPLMLSNSFVHGLAGGGC